MRELPTTEVLEIAIVENVQRADLSPMEEAEGYRALIDQFGRTQAQVAETVGKSRGHVANALRLLQLPASVQAMVREGQLTAGHARPLIGAADAERLAEEIVGRGLSVRQAEALAAAAARPAAPPRRGRQGRRHRSRWRPTWPRCWGCRWRSATPAARARSASATPAWSSSTTSAGG